MTSDYIRVILADDHAVVRAGLRAVLGSAKDIEVIAEVSSGRDAVARAERLDPDVVVMDLSMEGLDGLSATRELVAKGPRPRVVVLTMHAEEEFLMKSLEAGASGYLQKNAADRELVDAVRAVAHGDVYVQPPAARVLARGFKHHDDAAPLRAQYDRLSVREREVLRLVAEGYTAPEIGERLFISSKTVDTYKQRVAEKMGLTHRPDYVRCALKLGLLSVDAARTGEAGPK